MQLFWKETKGILTKTPSITCYGDIPFSPGTVGVSASFGSTGEMFQGFPGDPDTGSRGSSSPSLESQYLSSVESFGSPPTTSAPQECVSVTGGVGVGGGSTGTGAGVDMPSSFVPTVTAITTSQDLQWMVQPTLISSVAPGQSGTGSSTMTQPVALDPYDLPGPSFSSGGGFTPPSSDTPGPVRQSRSRRRARDEMLTPEEEDKRRVRRERNKLAAAKCRNRRRELTDRLQSDTDMLEEEKAELEAEISELQKEKERLEFVLVAHQPGCKIPYQEQPSAPLPLPLPQTSPQMPSVSVVGLTVKEDTFYLPPAYSSHHHHHHHVPVSQPTQTQPAPAQQQQGMMQEVAFSSSFYGQGQPAPDGSCLVADGGGNPDAGSYIPSYTSSFVFTYPEGACGASANQRTSSSDQSSDSLNSPSLLAL
ncbi:protein FosB [Sinocyclocheilus rhinocerous]|uniref:protein FosB n=1 Tax=Sinocyclocheilus rhinocerous TaxID=307959 RepID=UPI0007B9D6A8|nr:PREDICTED: protein fosB-like [Sinocyclocheilus rhinocerous]